MSKDGESRVHTPDTRGSTGMYHSPIGTKYSGDVHVEKPTIEEYQVASRQKLILFVTDSNQRMSLQTCLVNTKT